MSRQLHKKLHKEGSNAKQSLAQIVLITFRIQTILLRMRLHQPFLTLPNPTKFVGKILPFILRFI